MYSRRGEAGPRRTVARVFAETISGGHSYFCWSNARAAGSETVAVTAGDPDSQGNPCDHHGRNVGEKEHQPVLRPSPNEENEPDSEGSDKGRISPYLTAFGPYRVSLQPDSCPSIINAACNPIGNSTATEA
jgi:hypothetical protein